MGDGRGNDMIQVETPHRLRDVPDPCTEAYYPEWSSRGMRPVRCTRPAKATLTGDANPRRVCGIHGQKYERIYTRSAVTWDGGKE